ncbi:MAG TPA: VPLPA-CTERM sorting domain-containing protein [Burkholderiaceae bacterium]|nr:VPLPA-CTERM sorting domain-containing protein [Burkholderiaceae bacterium]
MKILRNLTAMAAVAAAVTMAAQARADTISFYLTQPECTDGCTAGDAPALISNSVAVEVTVTLTQSNFTTAATGTSDYATVTFTNYNASNIGVPVELNVNGEFMAASTEPLAPNSPCGGNGYTGAANICSTGSEDHFGTMSLETGAVGHQTFTIDLTAENGNSWANAASVLALTTGYASAYSQGFEAVVATGSNSTQDAGFYAVTPLPAALPLFAGGLGAMGLLRWRRKRKAQALAA